MVSKNNKILYCPHHFNGLEVKIYRIIPEIKHVGVHNIKVEDLPDFNTWYSAQADITDWSFKYELIKYCRVDVEV